MVEVKPQSSRSFVFLRCTVFNCSFWILTSFTYHPTKPYLCACLLTDLWPFSDWHQKGQEEKSPTRQQKAETHYSSVLLTPSRRRSSRPCVPSDMEKHSWTQLENCKSLSRLSFATVFLFRSVYSHPILIPSEWKLLVGIFGVGKKVILVTIRSGCTLWFSRVWVPRGTAPLVLEKRGCTVELETVVEDRTPPMVETPQVMRSHYCQTNSGKLYLPAGTGVA